MSRHFLGFDTPPLDQPEPEPVAARAVSGGYRCPWCTYSAVVSSLVEDHKAIGAAKPSEE